MATDLDYTLQSKSSGHLQILTGNVRSMRNKFDDVFFLMSQLQPDIVAITESWLSQDIGDSKI